jgi:hypothetical protein
MNAPAAQPDLIDIDSPASLDRWVRELNTTDAQLRDAVAEVGAKAADVEMHLKGSRSTTNDDRMKQSGAAG